MANELVLIVEDNPKNLKLVRDVLQVKGYKTVEATTGERGIQLAHEAHPDLILMDIQLPGIGGFDALRQLRGDPVTQARHRGDRLDDARRWPPDHGGRPR